MSRTRRIQTPIDRDAKCLLVLDANILIADFWWCGRDFNYLLTHVTLGHRLAIPRIALLEARANIERSANEVLAALPRKKGSSKLTDKIRRVFGKRDPARFESGAKLAQAYERFIRTQLKRIGGIVTKEPRVQLTTILDRSIRRTKPFSGGDKGFRDTLIWLGVLELVQEYQRVSFVTSNVGDFADNKKGALHPTLDDEVRRLLPEHIEFFFFRNLNGFIEYFEQQEPESASASAIAAALREERLPDFHLEDWLLGNIVRLSEEIHLDGVSWACIPQNLENPILSFVEKMVSCNVLDVECHGPDVAEFVCTVSLVGIYQCTVLFDSWRGLISGSQVVRVVEDPHDLFTAVWIRAVGMYCVSVKFDLTRRRVVTAVAVPVEAEVGAARSHLEDLDRAD